MGESAKSEITGARKTRESTDKHLVPSPFDLLPANLAHLPRTTEHEHPALQSRDRKEAVGRNNELPWSAAFTPLQCP